MICIVDFDQTFLKNDYFKESFFRMLLFKPHYMLKHFILDRKGLFELKFDLLSTLEIKYKIDHLVNPIVKDWITENNHKYEKVILVSASPDFFVKRVLKDSLIFDEIYGSEDVNLKGENKLAFIKEKWGNEFDYLGDSKADIPIFKASRNGYKITRKGLIHV